MICPKCSTLNDVNNAFCINCGEVFRSTPNLPPTLFQTDSDDPPQTPPAITHDHTDYLSTPTVFGAPQPKFEQSPANFEQSHYNAQQSQAKFNASQPVFQQSAANFNPSIPFIPPLPQPRKSKKGLLVGGSILLLLLLVGGIIGAIVLLKKAKPATEALPAHLGIFFQSADKTAVTEIQKQDFTNAMEGKDKILKDDSMPSVESKPNLILFSDGKDIPLSDLKLIQLDSVKPDGSMKQIDYKASPVEGKTEMKRLWVAENLAKGKYAFALLDGFFDEGKHKLWVFQVRESDKTDNGAMSKDVTVSLKSKSKNSNTNVTKATPSPKATVEPPTGSRTAYASTNNLSIRNAPSLTAPKIGSLRKGQKVYVIGNSTNYDNWNGMEGTWANIQTETGQRGWVFSPLINY
jgi:hypothetical protein